MIENTSGDPRFGRELDVVPGVHITDHRAVENDVRHPDLAFYDTGFTQRQH
jgi:hypothetical protein